MYKLKFKISEKISLSLVERAILQGSMATTAIWEWGKLKLQKCLFLFPPSPKLRFYKSSNFDPSTRKGYIFSLASFVLVIAICLASPAMAVESKQELEWCALKSNNVNVRTGPGKRYPIKWVYKRQNLPLKRLAEYDNWIKNRRP